MLIPAKTQTGKPNQYMLDKGRQTGSNNIYKLFLWQTPDRSTYRLNYWSMNQLEDIFEHCVKDEIKEF